MATPTWKAKGTFTSGTGALSVPFPTAGTYAVGDTAFLFIESANQSSISTWSSVDGLGVGTAGTTSGVMLEVYYKTITSATEANLSIPDTGDHTVAQIHVFSPCIPEMARTAGLATASTALTFPSIQTQGDNRLILLAAALNLDAASTATTSGYANAGLTGLTERHDQTVASGFGGGLVIATGTKATVGLTGSTTATVTSTAYVSMSISLMEKLAYSSFNAAHSYGYIHRNDLTSPPTLGLSFTDETLFATGAAGSGNYLSCARPPTTSAAAYVIRYETTQEKFNYSARTYSSFAVTVESAVSVGQSEANGYTARIASPYTLGRFIKSSETWSSLASNMPTSHGTNGVSGVSSSAASYMGGGVLTPSNTFSSVIDKLLHSTETMATMSVALSPARATIAVGNSSKAYFCGFDAEIDELDFATDTYADTAAVLRYPVHSGVVSAASRGFGSVSSSTTGYLLATGGFLATSYMYQGRGIATLSFATVTAGTSNYSLEISATSSVGSTPYVASSGPTTHNVTYTDSTSVAESLTSAWALLSSRSESSATSDSQSGGQAFTSTGSDSVVSTETTTGGLVSSVTLTESNAQSTLESSTQAAASARTETAAITEDVSGAGVAGVLATDSVAATATHSSTAAMSNTASETTAVSDTESAGQGMSGTLTETSATGETSQGGATLTASEIEQSAPTEQATSSAVLLATGADSTTPDETAVGTQATGSATSESATATHTQTTVQGMGATGADSIAASEAAISGNLMPGIAAEQAASAEQSVGTSAIATSRSDSHAVTDSISTLKSAAATATDSASVGEQQATSGLNSADQSESAAASESEAVSMVLVAADSESTAPDEACSSSSAMGSSSSDSAMPSESASNAHAMAAVGSDSVVSSTSATGVSLIPVSAVAGSLAVSEATSAVFNWLSSQSDSVTATETWYSLIVAAAAESALSALTDSTTNTLLNTAQRGESTGLAESADAALNGGAQNISVSQAESLSNSDSATSITVATRTASDSTSLTDSASGGALMPLVQTNSSALATSEAGVNTLSSSSQDSAASSDSTNAGNLASGSQQETSTATAQQFGDTALGVNASDSAALSESHAATQRHAADVVSVLTVNDAIGLTAMAFSDLTDTLSALVTADSGGSKSVSLSENLAVAEAALVLRQVVGDLQEALSSAEQSSVTQRLTAQIDLLLTAFDSAAATVSMGSSLVELFAAGEASSLISSSDLKAAPALTIRTTLERAMLHSETLREKLTTRIAKASVSTVTESENIKTITTKETVCAPSEQRI